MIAQDYRAFYAEIGIELPAWAAVEASVSCFADPDAHKNGDRNKSCSVNVEKGVWHCHGCGARGGAYDAAICRGYTPRRSMDLLVAYGLAERRAGVGDASGWPSSSPARRDGPRDAARPAPTPPALEVSARQLAGWQQALRDMRWPLRVMRAEHRLLWDRDTLLELGVGFDRGRIIFPIRDADGRLQGVLRYAPSHERVPKMLAARGTRLGLLPHPAADPTDDVLLVEGPPDMLAARSRRLPAFAIPGDDAWQREYASLFTGRRVLIVMDADDAGRRMAVRIARDLQGVAREALVVELHPERRDGADLTDWLADNATLSPAELRERIAAMACAVDVAA